MSVSATQTITGSKRVIALINAAQVPSTASSRAAQSVPACGHASSTADCGSHSAGNRSSGADMIYGTFKASDSVIPAQAGWHESMDPGLRRDDEPKRDRAKRLLRKVRPWKAVLELRSRGNGFAGTQDEAAIRDDRTAVAKSQAMEGCSGASDR